MQNVGRPWAALNRDTDASTYEPLVPKTSTGKPASYETWRTYQMSDHLSMWIALRVDFSREYLEGMAAGAGEVVIPVSAPIAPRR